MSFYQLDNAILWRTHVGPQPTVPAACDCEIKPLPKSNGRIDKTLTFEKRHMHNNGVMVKVCPLVSSEMKVFRKKGDSHSRKEITSIQVSVCLIPFDV